MGFKDSRKEDALSIDFLWGMIEDTETPKGSFPRVGKSLPDLARGFPSFFGPKALSHGSRLLQGRLNRLAKLIRILSPNRVGRKESSSWASQVCYNEAFKFVFSLCALGTCSKSFCKPHPSRLIRGEQQMFSAASSIFIPISNCSFRRTLSR